MKATESLPQGDLVSFFSDLDFRLGIHETMARQLNRQLATEFSVFDFIEVDENRMSDILAFLLNPKGTHGQGDLFLTHLLKRLRDTLPAGLEHARTTREALTHSITKHLRRIDIVLEAETFILAIENKIDAGEGNEQLSDYQKHLESRGLDYCLVYLTPDGRAGKSINAAVALKLQNNGRLRNLSYSTDLREWLEECRRWCEAEKMRHFLGDLLRYVETHISCASEKES